MHARLDKARVLHGQGLDKINDPQYHSSLSSLDRFCWEPLFTEKWHGDCVLEGKWSTYPDRHSCNHQRYEALEKKPFSDS
jgi:hypothetical protein